MLDSDIFLAKFVHGFQREYDASCAITCKILHRIAEMKHLSKTFLTCSHVPNVSNAVYHPPAFRAVHYRKRGHICKSASVSGYCSSNFIAYNMPGELCGNYR